MTAMSQTSNAPVPGVPAWATGRQPVFSAFATFCFIAVFAGLLATPHANAQAGWSERGRGEMLYQNHCIACHTTQVHWRDQRLAKDWPSLRAQVRRWERNTGLTWNEDDVEAVSRYLNALYYQFPEPAVEKSISRLMGGHRSSVGQGNAWLSKDFLNGD